MCQLDDDEAGALIPTSFITKGRNATYIIPLPSVSPCLYEHINLPSSANKCSIDFWPTIWTTALENLYIRPKVIRVMPSFSLLHTSLCNGHKLEKKSLNMCLKNTDVYPWERAFSASKIRIWRRWTVIFLNVCNLTQKICLILQPFITLRGSSART